MYLKIFVSSDKLEDINFFMNELLNLVERLGIEKKGPISLPRKVLRISTMRTLGKRGKKIYETYQLRIYRKVIYVAYDERFMKEFLRLQIPASVKPKLKVVNK